MIKIKVFSVFQDLFWTASPLLVVARAPPGLFRCCHWVWPSHHLAAYPSRSISIHPWKLTAGYPKWWFAKCIILLNMAIFGIYVRFLGCIHIHFHTHPSTSLLFYLSLSPHPSLRLSIHVSRVSVYLTLFLYMPAILSYLIPSYFILSNLV